jgi:hypothetical protein
MTVRWEAVDWTTPSIAVLSGVVMRKLALPDVAEVLSSGSEFITPGIEFLFEAAARGVLPLRLGRKRFRCPGGVGCSVVP